MKNEKSTDYQKITELKITQLTNHFAQIGLLTNGLPGAFAGFKMSPLSNKQNFKVIDDNGLVINDNGLAKQAESLSKDSKDTDDKVKNKSDK